jgi:hypothetical protein
MKSFDVVIIGGGLGGLSCGAILSKEGLGVCVLEKHSVVGGCLQSFRREGRTLDTGMHYVGSLSEGQIMHQYLKYFGVIDSLRLQKLDENGFDEFHFKDGTSYCHAMGYENFIETLASQFPGERSGLKTLCKTIQDIAPYVWVKFSHKIYYSLAKLGFELPVFFSPVLHFGVEPLLIVSQRHRSKQGDHLGMFAQVVWLHAHQYRRDIKAFVMSLGSPNVLSIEHIIVAIDVFQCSPFCKQIGGKDSVGIFKRIDTREKCLFINRIVFQ